MERACECVQVRVQAAETAAAMYREQGDALRQQLRGAVEAVDAIRAFAESLSEGRDGRAVEWRIGHDLLAILDHPGGQ